MTYIDPGHKLRTDPLFRGKVEKLVDQIKILERKSFTSAKHAQDLRYRVHDLYKLCNYNAGLLVPYFFPNFHGAGTPLSLFARPFSFAMFHLQVLGYVTLRASRQIGKSTTLACRQLINSKMIPGFSSVYIVPHSDHLQTYANRLRDMERSFRFYKESRKFRQNLKFKEYPNKSKIELIRVLTTAAASRGKSADELLFDEYQHFDDDLYPEVAQIQKASKIPMTVYAGTSLTIDTPLESKYQSSSQGMWFIRARDGKNWINTGDKEEVLKVIGPMGPTCPYTGKILDVTDGEFVHADRHMLDAGHVGFHIPQIIIPEFANSLTKWDEIYEAYEQFDTNKFLQEVLGIPTEDGVREITQPDLERMCVLPDTPEQLRQKAVSGRYKFVVSGCDWGGSDHVPSERIKVSNTVHVILGVNHDKTIDILHMRQHTGMGYRNIANEIIKDHVAFGGTAIATDAGVGMAYNMLIRESQHIKAERHLIFNYTAPNTAIMGAPKQGHGWFNQFSLNRTESITTLFSAIKQEKPRIRCYNWGLAKHLLGEFLNLYRVPTENTTGTYMFRYRRHGSKPDDTLHAVNFAYVLCRVLLREPVVEDKSLKDRLDEVFLGNAKPTQLYNLYSQGHISG